MKSIGNGVGRLRVQTFQSRSSVEKDALHVVAVFRMKIQIPTIWCETCGRIPASSDLSYGW
jgi:hypothetical protein